MRIARRLPSALLAKLTGNAAAGVERMPAGKRRRASGIVLDENIGAHLLHIAHAAERHGDIEFLADDF